MQPDQMAYYSYAEYVKTGKYYLKTNSIHIGNWQEHYDAVMNLMRDGIETDFLQRNFITVDFDNGDVVELSIFDLYVNLMFWYPVVKQGQIIDGRHLQFHEAETKDTIKYFIDTFVIAPFRKIMDSADLNSDLADTTHRFIESNEFAMFLANTINLKDSIDLMNLSEEFNQLMHVKFPNTPIEEVKDEGMKVAQRAAEIIKDSSKILGYDHCLANAFRSKEAVNMRQYKEFANHIGSKPNGQGGVHAAIIDGSYLGGALNTVLAQFIDSNSSRVAQIQMKNNTGDSGGFARILGLNNIESFFHDDSQYDCHTHNYEEIVVKNDKVLGLLIDRYYRLDPEGIEYIVREDDVFLIGQKIYLRSPMTCASAARGNGVCYKCYGDLAYTNRYIKPGKYAAEKVSAELTQRQLSAKHLLETMIVALKWLMNFLEFFVVDINVVKLDKSKDFTGYKLIIDPDAIDRVNEDDYEKTDYFDGDVEVSSDYNEYLKYCYLELPDGTTVTVGTEDGDKLYLTNDFRVYISKNAKRSEDDMLEIDLGDICEKYDDFSLFFVKLDNNELSKVLNDLQDLINSKDAVAANDRNSILQNMLDLIIEGKLHIMSVHMEMILMNQIRSTEDILEKPDWDIPGVPYELLTLDRSLTDNPSVTISLLFQNLSRVLYNPLTYKKTAANPMDLFFMKQPQNFLNDSSNIVQTVHTEEEFCPVIRHHVEGKKD